MTVSFIGAASAAATSLTLPAHQKGDLIICWAHNSANTTSPTMPAGWSNLYNISRSVGANRGTTVAHKQAASSAETSGTWTNAQIMGCLIYRDSDNLITIGAHNLLQDINSTSWTYNSLGAQNAANSTLHIRSASAFIVLLAACNSNALAIETAPSSFTQRLTLAGASANEIAAFESNTAIASFAGATITLASTGIGSTFTLEIYDTGIAKSSGGGFRLVNIRGGADQ